MKKQLLIFFLAMFPFFAVPKPNNTELLVHLKDMQIIGQKDLKKISADAEKLHQKIGPDFSLITHILYDFFDITGLTKEHTKIEKLMFYYICNEIQPLSTISDLLCAADDKTEEKILAEFGLENFDATIREQSDKNFSHIVKTLLKKYRSEGDIRTEEQMIPLFYSEDARELELFLLNHRIFILLLEDIDNTIKKLT
jgi:hypothetical protein